MRDVPLIGNLNTWLSLSPSLSNLFYFSIVVQAHNFSFDQTLFQDQKVSINTKSMCSDFNAFKTNQNWTISFHEH